MHKGYYFIIYMHTYRGCLVYIIRESIVIKFPCQKGEVLYQKGDKFIESQNFPSLVL
jgi:hypothetical protein